MPSDSSPLISVIIVCKDPGPRLKDALASIWAQHISPPPEIIVVDGGSEDGSRVWLASQRSRLATLVMEPDKGIFDAMNKGVAKATGEWVFFLGADDKFFHDAVLNRTQSALKQTTAGVAVAEIAFEDGRVFALPAKLSPLDRNFVRHQGAFYRRSLFAEHGNFDASLIATGDYDFNLRLWQKKVVFIPLPLRTTVCGVGGATESGKLAVCQEEIKVRHRYFPAWKCVVADLGSMANIAQSNSPPRGAAPKAK